MYRLPGILKKSNPSCSYSYKSYRSNFPSITTQENLSKINNSDEHDNYHEFNLNVAIPEDSDNSDDSSFSDESDIGSASKQLGNKKFSNEKTNFIKKLIMQKTQSKPVLERKSMGKSISIKKNTGNTKTLESNCILYIDHSFINANVQGRFLKIKKIALFKLLIH